MQMGVGGVRFCGKKCYEGVRFNVISITMGWVGVKFPGKKRYVTLEWPLTYTHASTNVNKHCVHPAGEGFDTAKIVDAARTSFQNLISHLPSMFPGIATDTHAGLRERGSLIRFLGHGLSRVNTPQMALKSTHGVATCHLNSQVWNICIRQKIYSCVALYISNIVCQETLTKA